MKTLNPPKRSKPPVPVSIAKTVAPSNPPQLPTSEAVSLALRARVIERASQRIAQQRKTRLELKKKAQTKAVLPKVSPRPPAITLTQPFTRKLAAIPPAEAAEPKLTPAAIRALNFAVKCMERPDWSPNQRRLAAFFHLRQDPLTATLSPDDLIFEQSTPNSCSTQSRLAPSSDGTRAGL